MKIKKINPIARLMAYNRRRKQVLPNKKKYDRKKEHEKLWYNSLIKVEKHEKNTMRTHYLVRDWWSKKQLIELRDFINETIKEKGDD